MQEDAYQFQQPSSKLEDEQVRESAVSQMKKNMRALYVVMRSQMLLARLQQMRACHVSDTRVSGSDHTHACHGFSEIFDYFFIAGINFCSHCYTGS